jgi:murein L,D-transpeptidase YafK
VLSSALAIAPASAFRIELKDVAPDRIERQRAEAIGQLPLPGTPPIGQLEARLKDNGFALGAPVFIRTFKTESELEVWMLKGERFELFATYPVCHWSGTLGPKVAEGDKQTPEGVYTVTQKQVHISGRHPKALNLGFPNILDRQYQRTGSYILIHGGCGSVGCFAMTNPVIDELFTLTQAAFRAGQQHIQVHAFPFRLTEANLRGHALHDWYDFWRNLKDVADAFERTRRPPRVAVCEGRYWVEDETTGGGSQSPLALCGVPDTSPNTPMASAPQTTAANSALPPLRFAASSRPNQPLGQPFVQRPPGQLPALPLQLASQSSAPPRSLQAQLHFLRHRDLQILCSPEQPACRKWIAGKVRAFQIVEQARVQTAARVQPRRTP